VSIPVPLQQIAAVAAALTLWACSPPADRANSCPPLLQLDTSEYVGWLESECHANWTAESGILQATKSDGYAQVFLSPQLLLSLEQGADTHPVGSAALRVMYLDDRKTVRGYSISLKTHASNLDNWFWYEHFSNQESPLTARNNAPSCVGCHSHGSDFVQSTLPLR